MLLSLRYKNLRRGISDYELFEALREVKGDDFVDILFDRIICTRNMSEYHELIRGKTNNLFSHKWDDFNSLKADVLALLSK